MSERDCVEPKRSNLALTAPSFLEILEAQGVANPKNVLPDVSGDQQSLALPEECHLACAMAGRVDDLQAPGHWHRLAFDNVPVYVNRLHPLVLAPDKAVDNLLHKAGCRVHGAERTSGLGNRDVQGVHVGGRAGLTNDRGRAADVVGMMVREDEVTEITRAAAELADSIEHDRCLVGKARIDERELRSCVEQHGVRHA